MIKVITYGTFDIIHEGHIRLLKRAKALGDHLIVGITSDSYDKYRGKLNIVDPLPSRIDNIKATGLADEIIVEEYEGQKIDDIVDKEIDIFAIGSDWAGQFDYLNDYCKVVYLERTRGVSSTELRNDAHGLVHFGIVGAGRQAGLFFPESKFVSGITAECIFDYNIDTAKEYAAKHELSYCTNNYGELLSQVSAVYIATPPITRYNYAKQAILAGKHVLCEPPMTLFSAQTEELFDLAQEKNLVLMEGLITLHCPGFQRLVSLAKSGRIGDIKSLSVSHTRPAHPGSREMKGNTGGGSMSELSPYPLLALHKLLGGNPESICFTSQESPDGTDMMTTIALRYQSTVANVLLGLGVHSENQLIISGTRGYIHVASPWWKTEYFEIRHTDSGETRKFFYEFIGEGIRYELVAFLKEIASGGGGLGFRQISSAQAAIIEEYRKKGNVEIIV
ncbi:MAG: Gfo/Idh/MocA family oxidoreductase [Oscillospiraceae bacterium]|nr:Gfo/Idh/MocA family oxidoreductase [Oscillospiraceae bacterium]